MNGFPFHLMPDFTGDAQYAGPGGDWQGRVFPVRIYAVTESAGYPQYSWVEQGFEPAAGDFEDAHSPREGNADNGELAREVNDALLDPGADGFFAWLRLRGNVGGRGLWEFEASSGAGSSTVTNDTPAGPASGDLSLSGPTLTDIAGATVTVNPSVTTVYLFWATVTFEGDGTAVLGDVYAVALLVDGAAEAAKGVWSPSSSDAKGTVTVVWKKELAAGSHTVKLQAQRLAGTGTAKVEADHSKLIGHAETKVTGGAFSFADVAFTGAVTVSGTASFAWSSTGLFVWTGGGMTFAVTTNAAVRPTGYLVLPRFNFAGKPTYVGTAGEVGCQGKNVWQYDGTDWWQYLGVKDDDTIAAGDLFYHDGTQLKPLAKEGNGDLLTLTAGLPDWKSPAALGLPTWQKYSVTVVDVAGTKKFRVTAPDGTTADTNCAAATTQTFTLTSPAAGVVLSSVKRTLPTAFTGVLGVTFAVGYSGGDGAPAADDDGYVTSIANAVATRPLVYGAAGVAFAGAGEAPCPHQTSAWNVTLKVSGTTNLTNLNAGGELNLWLLPGAAA